MTPSDENQPAGTTALTFKDIRRLYDEGANIMGLFRERTGAAENSLDAILTSYDLQSGNYTKALENPEHRQKLEAYASTFAAVLDALDGDSILEVGVGEATTLCNVVSRLKRAPREVLGFDLSWSRIAFALRYASQFPAIHPRFFTGDLFAIPLPDSSVDIVYTAHSLEPNHGREKQALEELYRITRKWLVLCEPSYELGGEATRRHIEKNGYVRNLPGLAQELGYRITEHRLLDATWVPHNQTGLLVIAKDSAAPAPDETPLGCPNCKAALRAARGNYFCENCLQVFPVIDGIPCLLPANGILATKYLECP